MRILAILACGALAACAGGAVTVPSEQSVITEVPQAGSASTYGGGSDFTSTISNALDESGQPVPGSQATLAGSPDGTGSDPNVLTSIETPHYRNFIDALRANDAKLLTCDIMEGHLSSTLPHLANIAYRVGRQLQFDGKSEQFVNDAEADRLLTREYRAGFEMPKLT